MFKNKRLIYCIALFVLSLGLMLFKSNTTTGASTSYSVTFNYNSQQVSEYLPEEISSTLKMYTISVNSGEYAVETTKPKDSLKDYYLYEWTVNGQTIDLETYPITKNVTFVAKYTPVEYTIHYNYTTEEENEITNIVYETKYTVESEDIYYYRPARANYIFVDWYSSNNYLVDYLEIYRPAKSIGDKNLYAKWQANVYYINYNTDAENLNNPNTYTIEDEDIILSSPTKTGHIFKGWYLDENYTQAFTTIQSGSTGDINLYPKWELEKYNVTYILPDGSTQKILVEYGKTAGLPEMSVGLFDIIKTDVSRKNITEDITIHIEKINIWYVYVLALLLIVIIISAIVISRKKKHASLNKLRVKYQSNLRLVKKRKSK